MMHETIIKYHNANAMGFTLPSESFHHAVNDCRRGLRHKNIIGRRGAAVFVVPITGLGGIHFTSTKSDNLGERVEEQTFRIRLARRTLQRVFKKTSPPVFLS